MLLQTLQSYGLSEKEAKIYLLCLEYGMLQTAKIASLAHINRTSCYDLLETMKAKQLLIATQKSGIKYYSANSPELLFAGLKEKYSAFESILPELIGLSSKFGIKPKIKIFEGLEGMKQAYRDTLSSKEDILAILGNEIMYPALTQWLDKNYVPERVEKGIFAKVLLSNNEKNKAYNKQDKKNFRTSQFFKNTIDFGCEVNCYGPGKVMIALYNEQELHSLILESQPLYETIKTLFINLWE